MKAQHGQRRPNKAEAGRFFWGSVLGPRKRSDDERWLRVFGTWPNPKEPYWVPYVALVALVRPSGVCGVPEFWQRIRTVSV